MSSTICVFYKFIFTCNNKSYDFFGTTSEKVEKYFIINFPLHYVTCLLRTIMCIVCPVSPSFLSLYLSELSSPLFASMPATRQLATISTTQPQDIPDHWESLVPLVEESEEEEWLIRDTDEEASEEAPEEQAGEPESEPEPEPESEPAEETMPEPESAEEKMPQSEPMEEKEPEPEPETEEGLITEEETLKKEKEDEETMEEEPEEQEEAIQPRVPATERGPRAIQPRFEASERGPRALDRLPPRPQALPRPSSSPSGTRQAPITIDEDEPGAEEPAEETPTGTRARAQRREVREEGRRARARALLGMQWEGLPKPSAPTRGSLGLRLRSTSSTEPRALPKAKPAAAPPSPSVASPRPAARPKPAAKPRAVLALPKPAAEAGHAWAQQPTLQGSRGAQASAPIARRPGATPCPRMFTMGDVACLPPDHPWADLVAYPCPRSGNVYNTRAGPRVRPCYRCRQPPVLTRAVTQVPCLACGAAQRGNKSLTCRQNCQGYIARSVENSVLRRLFEHGFFGIPGSPEDAVGTSESPREPYHLSRQQQLDLVEELRSEWVRLHGTRELPHEWKANSPRNRRYTTNMVDPRYADRHDRVGLVVSMRLPEAWYHAEEGQRWPLARRLFYAATARYADQMVAYLGGSARVTGVCFAARTPGVDRVQEHQDLVGSATDTYRRHALTVILDLGPTPNQIGTVIRPGSQVWGWDIHNLVNRQDQLPVVPRVSGLIFEATTRHWTHPGDPPGPLPAPGQRSRDLAEGLRLRVIYQITSTILPQAVIDENGLAYGGHSWPVVEPPPDDPSQGEEDDAGAD